MARALDLTTLFDLDGTLADHNSALKRDYNLIKSPGEPEFEPFPENPLEHVKERIKLVRNQPGWWENLPRYEPGFEILSVTKELGFRIKILTKGPSNLDYAWTEKVKWVKKQPELIDAGIYLVEDKENGDNSKSSIDGRVLIDDYPKYLTPWLNNRPRGIGIMPAQEYNKDFEHERVIRYDGTNLNQIKEILTWVRDRRNKEPITTAIGLSHKHERN